MENQGDFLYLIIRTLFAGSLLAFLFAIVRFTLKELQDSIDSQPPESIAVQPCRLVVLNADAPGLPIGTSFVAFGKSMLGRSVSCDLQILDSSVSAEHAVLGPVNGSWWLNDLESRNGTYVGGTRITGSAELADGDIVQLGQVQFRFLC